MCLVYMHIGRCFFAVCGIMAQSGTICQVRQFGVVGSLDKSKRTSQVHHFGVVGNMAEYVWTSEVIMSCCFDVA